MSNVTNTDETFPRISFVMPVYNDGKSVGKAIRSIFDCDYPNIEVIAVNDGSTDNTKQVLDKLAKEFKYLSVVHQANQGACVARNEGAKRASGKYLAWLPADAVIYPHAIRKWIETLEANPDYDGLYGGYKFVDDEGNTVQNYMSEKFEPYLLEVQNYIDGSFPIKAETFWRIAKEVGQPDGLWDPAIKSLQDWDFWLSVVKHGGKLLYYQDMFFETTLPHPGGLSYDSHQNWLARTKAIKVKHGIPIRKICVTAPGAPFFGKYIAKILDADYKEMPPFKDHDYDLIYLLGYYPSIAEQCSMTFIHPKFFGQYLDLVQQAKEVPLAPAVKVVHLIGTDLLQMGDLPMNHMKVIQHFLNNKYDHTFTEFEPTQREAQSLGIPTEVLPLPPRTFFEATKFPKQFTVAVYAPSVNQALYSVDLMKQVAKKLPKVAFKFFGTDTVGREGDNIEHVGYVHDMPAFIKDCSCLLRMTLHDGLPQSVLEFLSAGRRVVFSMDFPHVNVCKQMTVDAVVKAIKHEMQQGVNEEAAAWIRKEFTHKAFKKKIYSLLEYDPKKYWEQQSDRWIFMSERVYDTRDWEAIEPYVEKLKPTSVLDVGCGTGQWSKHFGKGYTGIDISTSLIDHAKRKFPDRTFEASSLEDYTAHSKYDLAFCYTVFEHIPERNMPKAVAVLKRVARKAIIVEPENIETKYYCHNHDYAKWFDIKEKKTLGKRTLMLVDLS